MSQRSPWLRIVVRYRLTAHNEQVFAGPGAALSAAAEQGIHYLDNIACLHSTET